jgi:hypothetical protein
MAECMLRMGDRAHADQLVEEARLAFELHGARFDLAELAQRAGVQFEQQ